MLHLHLLTQSMQVIEMGNGGREKLKLVVAVVVVQWWYVGREAPTD